MTGTDPTVPPQPAGLLTRRLHSIDAARGTAVVMMVVYHLCWDLVYFGHADFDLLHDPYWRAFNRAILGSFLALVGLSLVLAHGERWHPRPFLRRLAIIAACAAAVTTGSALLFPDSFVYFGVLHHIAVASVLGLGFLRLPPAVTVAAAIAALLASDIFTSPAFNTPWLWWLGLSTNARVANDFVPILPWFGLVLLGVAAGRLVLPHHRDLLLPAWQPHGRLSRGLTWAGRHSLVVYLAHQPVLLGLLYAGSLAGIGAPSATAVFRQPSPTVVEAFLGACVQACTAPERGAGACAAYCHCLAVELGARGLWQEALGLAAEPASAPQSAELSALIEDCADRHGLAP